MILIACVDNRNGMMFNHRRQSQDRVLRSDVLSLTKGKKLWMNAYSRKQFTEENTEQIETEEAYFSKAGSGEYCFAENADFFQNADKIEEIYLYHWNRDYPADTYFPIDLSSWKCVETAEFTGSSHEKITRERYVR